MAGDLISWGFRAMFPADPSDDMISSDIFVDVAKKLRLFQLLATGYAIPVSMYFIQTGWLYTVG
jgi:hypothetical protein